MVNDHSYHWTPASKCQNSIFTHNRRTTICYSGWRLHPRFGRLPQVSKHWDRTWSLIKNCPHKFMNSEPLLVNNLIDHNINSNLKIFVFLPKQFFYLKRTLVSHRKRRINQICQIRCSQQSALHSWGEIQLQFERNRKCVLKDAASYVERESSTNVIGSCLFPSFPFSFPVWGRCNSNKLAYLLVRLPHCQLILYMST